MEQSLTITLKQEAVEYIKSSLPVRNKIATDLNKSPRTIDRYIAANSPKLADSRVVEILTRETGLPKNALLQSA